MLTLYEVPVNYLNALKEFYTADVSLMRTCIKFEDAALSGFRGVING